MSEFAKYALYFLIGGLVVSVSSYLGAKGEGFLAAFASTFQSSGPRSAQSASAIAMPMSATSAVATKPRSEACR